MDNKIVRKTESREDRKYERLKVRKMDENLKV